MMRPRHICMAKRILIGILAGFVAFSGYTLWSENRTISAEGSAQKETASSSNASGSGGTAETPNKKTIEDIAHSWQTLNNCSSIGLMGALSHWGIRDSQEVIAQATRPWNNPRGDNDDKSVTLRSEEHTSE